MLFIIMIILYVTADDEHPQRKKWANGILIFYGVCFLLSMCSAMFS